ncbi:MAG: cellulase family glycosylhydrolase [Prolixibacteraceae bacterium]|jgi:mannan endo-1,4-beta-mannosidase|nr:cellulase family glycosylhydrolase [Prolixibacteraceae bacterium]
MIKNILVLVFTFLVALYGFSQEYSGFKVEGRFLYDQCGEKVILRGVSNPNIWFEKNGIPRMEEIEKTGANVVRIVWETKGSSTLLDAAISNCRAQNMIPMVEVHDATGDINKVPDCVDYWTRSDVTNVLLKHEKYLLLNIANEPGNGSVSNSKFTSTYEDAISQIREAGIHVPLIIDGTDWGKNINIMQSQGPGLIEFDPDHNLIFAVHMWWPKMYGFTENDIIQELTQSANMDLPLIVGEFSQMHGNCDDYALTSNSTIEYKTIMEECQKTETGFIAWSWFGNCNYRWDMSDDGTFDGLYDWGLEVAVDNEFSIKNTSVRPYSILNNECDPTIGVGIGDYNSKGIQLEQNFPNPVKGSTTIKYSIKNQSLVRLTIYNIQGKTISQLINQKQESGTYAVEFETSILENGVYFYSLQVGNTSTTKKMVVLR